VLPMWKYLNSVENPPVRLDKDDKDRCLYARDYASKKGSSPILMAGFENAWDSVSFWDERINHRTLSCITRPGRKLES